MKKPGSMRGLEKLGRVRLSKSFYMRDFLYSEIANIHGIPNIPDNPDLAIAASQRLSEELLEPLNAMFGWVAVRSAFRFCELNAFGNCNNLNCARNESNYAAHIWDRRDADGAMGPSASIAIPWFTDRYEAGTDWRALAGCTHDYLPYSGLFFYPKVAAFSIKWHENPERRIGSYIAPKGCLTRPGHDNHEGDHSAWYEDFPKSL